jgi:hypothetical protein
MHAAAGTKVLYDLRPGFRLSLSDAEPRQACIPQCARSACLTNESCRSRGGRAGLLAAPTLPLPPAAADVSIGSVRITIGPVVNHVQRERAREPNILRALRGLRGSKKRADLKVGPCDYRRSGGSRTLRLLDVAHPASTYESVDDPLLEGKITKWRSVRIRFRTDRIRLVLG